MPPAIREAGPADLDAVLALYRDLSPGDPAPDPARAGAAWTALLGSGLTTVLLALDEGVPAATCLLAVLPNLTRGARSIGIIENVVTHAGHRRRGLGHALLAATLERAWEAGCYKVLLATGSDDPGTLAFYERAGFTRGTKTAFEARRPWIAPAV